ncbi:TIGR03089 family protein [Angustibacter aerolatus]
MTPAELLQSLVHADPARPRVTFYDDAPGPTRGERIELSGRVLANWVSKAANLLVDEVDVEPGDVVAVVLPTHWRALYWALAVWTAGGVLALEPHPEARVVVTDDPAAVEGADVVAVSLPALSRRWDGELPRGAVDEAADLSSQPDVFVPLEDPLPGAPALVTGAGVLDGDAVVAAARELAAGLGYGPGARVRTSAALRDAAGVAGLLAPWTVDGSLVLVRDPDPAAADARAAAERVTDG